MNIIPCTQPLPYKIERYNVWSVYIVGNISLDHIYWIQVIQSSKKKPHRVPRKVKLAKRFV